MRWTVQLLKVVDFVDARLQKLFAVNKAKLTLAGDCDGFEIVYVNCVPVSDYRKAENVYDNSWFRRWLSEELHETRRSENTQPEFNKKEIRSPVFATNLLPRVVAPK